MIAATKKPIWKMKNVVGYMVKGFDACTTTTKIVLHDHPDIYL
jgi:hypothetical protein